MLDIFEDRKNLVFDLNNVNFKDKPTAKIQTVLRYLRALDDGTTNPNSKRKCDYGQSYLAEPFNMPVVGKLEAVSILKKFFLQKYQDPQQQIKSPNYYTLMHFVRFLAKQYRGLDQQPIFNINDNEMAQVYFGSVDAAVNLRFDLVKLLYELAFV